MACILMSCLSVHTLRSVPGLLWYKCECRPNTGQCVGTAVTIYICSLTHKVQVVHHIMCMDMGACWPWPNPLCQSFEFGFWLGADLHDQQEWGGA